VDRCIASRDLEFLQNIIGNVKKLTLRYCCWKSVFNVCENEKGSAKDIRRHGRDLVNALETGDAMW